LNPEDPNTHYSLGRALLAKGQPGDAVDPLCQALRLSPDDAHTHNTLAVALARLKDFPAAVLELQTALRIESDNSLFRSNLSCVERRSEACSLVP
jgi:Flp pilus assembly protein TadD